MIRHTLLLSVAVALMALVLPATPAAAQPLFEAEISCGGEVPPGGSVAVEAKFENQTFDTMDVTGSISITIPGMGQFTLGNFNFTLGPNQNLIKTTNFGLPPSAPFGDYSMRISASTSTGLSASDTCSFKVR